MKTEIKADLAKKVMEEISKIIELCPNFDQFPPIDMFFLYAFHNTYMTRHDKISRMLRNRKN